jgi:signal transduction histidine kinase
MQPCGPMEDVTGVRRPIAIGIPIVAALGVLGAEIVGRGTPQGGALIWAPLAVSCAAVGALLWYRRVGGALAGLFVYIGLYLPAGLLLQDYAYRAMSGAALAAWAFQVSIAISLVFVLILQLFPTGRPLSPRWRWLMWATIGSVLVSAAGAGLGPTTEFAANFPAIEHPLQLLSRSGAEGVTLVGNLAGALAFLASAAEIVMRFRRSTGDERLQMKGFAFAAAIAAIGFAIGVATIPSGPAIAFAVLAPLIPIAAGVSIVKYHLYDIDLVIRKALVFGLLAAFITLVYAAIVGLVSAEFHGTTLGSFVAAAALAVLFAPARDRARMIADRLVYGTRATPYEVLAEFSERMGESYAADDVLLRMASVLMEGTGASGARVLLRVGTEQRTAAKSGAPGEESLVPVTHQGEELGALAVTMPATDPMDPAKLQLIEDLAAQAGLVLRNVKLIEELKASRQRLVAAQDEERRKIERNIHDGAQQQLVALAVQLKLAEQLAGKDPGAERALLSKLGEQANEALEDLRDLARGIYPPLLADKGLHAALKAQARKAAVPTSVEADGIERLSQEVESAVYFSCLEALQNVAKYAHASRASIALANGSCQLRFTVTDDGEGFDPATTGYGTGLQGIADRLAVLRGEITVSSAPGEGTSVTGTVPT